MWLKAYSFTHTDEHGLNCRCCWGQSREPWGMLWESLCIPSAHLWFLAALRSERGRVGSGKGLGLAPRSKGCGGGIRPQLCPQTQWPRAVGERDLVPQTYLRAQDLKLWPESQRNQVLLSGTSHCYPGMGELPGASAGGMRWACGGSGSSLSTDRGGAAVHRKGLLGEEAGLSTQDRCP